MKEVLKMDLSTVVQKVSLNHITMANITVFFYYSLNIQKTFYISFQLTDSDLTCQQGFSSLNDTPHMVTEQTRSVVESEFLALVSFPFSAFRPFVDTDGLSK